MDLVLITGSNGLIGSALARALVPDYRVIGLDLKPPKDPLLEKLDGFEWITTDMTDEGSVNHTLDEILRRHGTSEPEEKLKVASVIHLAAYYDFSGDPSELYDKLTVQGTRRLLRALRSRPKLTVEQFVFSSTLLVMKPCEPGDVLRESSPVQAEWEYPESKLRAESVIRAERGGIPSVVLRIAGVYDDFGHSPPLTQQIARIHKRSLESYFYPGDKHRGQSFVHLDDVVDAIRRTVDRRERLDPEEVFLIGEQDVMTYEELQDQIGGLLHGHEWPSLRIPKPAAKMGAWVKDKLAHDQAFIKPWMIDIADAHYPVSNERAARKLEWSPRNSLRDTIPKIVGSLLADPARWYEAHRIEPPRGLSPGDRRAPKGAA